MEPKNTTRNPIVRDLIAGLIEAEGADAIVVLWTRTRKDGTTAHIATWGNQFAARALVAQSFADYQAASAQRRARRSIDSNGE